MTPADLNFATECVRGIHTALAALKRWVATKELASHDETFIKAIDHAGLAAKEWLRAKVIESGKQQNPHE